LKLCFIFSIFACVFVAAGVVTCPQLAQGLHRQPVHVQSQVLFFFHRCLLLLLLLLLLPACLPAAACCKRGVKWRS